jgi:glucans biosynthesis protein C
LPACGGCRCCSWCPAWAPGTRSAPGPRPASSENAWRGCWSPFLVGLLLVVPPQVYYRLRFQGQDPGSYWEFYGDFFQVHLGLKFPWFIRPDEPPDLFEPAHLWFLYFLLVYSLLLLSALLYLGGSGRQLLERLASLCARPWAIFLLALPVAVIEAILGTEESGGWNRYAYIPFLLYGFLLAADLRFGEAIRRHARAASLSAFPPCSCCLGSASMSARWQDEIRRLPMTAGACFGGS